MNKLSDFFAHNRFNIISWTITMALAACLLGSALVWRQSTSSAQALVPQPTVAPDENLPQVALPAVPGLEPGFQSIERNIQLKTNIPADRSRYEAVNYRVSRGDAMFSIAKQFNIKPETILYSNKDVLEDNPHSLRPGIELIIPPVDGLYYKWKDGDTIEKVAKEFKAEPDDVLNFPGNKLDVTNPEIKPGTLVMIPGGERELIDWASFIPTIARNPKGGTGTSEVGGNQCAGGPIGSGFIWPTQGPHTVSGNDYSPGHLGIDITGNTGDPAMASSAGVVTMAQGGYNYGYGNVVQIDHGNGYTTIYAHLNSYSVSPCQAVAAGQFIGTIGNTGNSFGSHLHFEIREGGTNINPLYVVQ